MQTDLFMALAEGLLFGIRNLGITEYELWPEVVNMKEMCC